MKYKRKGSGAQDHSGCRRGAYERHFIVWQPYHTPLRHRLSYLQCLIQETVM